MMFGLTIMRLPIMAIGAALGGWLAGFAYLRGVWWMAQRAYNDMQDDEK